MRGRVRFAGTVLPEAPSRPAPPNVLTAARLMYAGAAIELIFGIRELIRRVSMVRNDDVLIVRTLGHIQVYSATTALLTGIVGMLVSPALWLWMARACRTARNWARIMSTVFFAISTLNFALFIVRPGADGVLWKLLTIATWLVGLLAVRLLWARDSSGFFRPPSEARQVSDAAADGAGST
jgi:hypothetical protein